ncbi:PTS system mannose/fructose/sorbose family transporter subunit IID [Collinsella tanakaei]|uniref:PTS system mannose/fructose/sorbose family transporter subunit IID n=1 Tax=Collinsella tanakaei TaxID=626935 RepID=UPI0029432E16|nr:PTS system mannose/fructose/sorbose family transporter subunit IID [Collinsella tanakaei]
MTTSNGTNSSSITKQDLRKVFFRSLTMEYSWNYERQQHMGFCYSMLPIIRRVYDNKEDQIQAAKRHMEFFNTTPYISTLILGISSAMEEANANDDRFDASSINSIKAALMSPLAGIGDSLFWGTLRVIATGLGVSLSMQGNILGPLLFLLVFNIPAYIVRWLCLKWGYGFGTSFLSKIEESGMMPKLTMGAAILGLMVIGAMVPNLVSVSVAGSLGTGDSAQSIQSIIDGIMPSLLPLLVTFGVFQLVQHKVKIAWILVILMAVGIIGSFFGIFAV